VLHLARNKSAYVYIENYRKNTHNNMNGLVEHLLQQKNKNRYIEYTAFIMGKGNRSLPENNFES